jgi:hypothetical protein
VVGVNYFNNQPEMVALIDAVERTDHLPPNDDERWNVTDWLKDIGS